MTSELQESVDSIKIQVEKANAAMAENQTKMDGTDEELKKLSDEHTESTTALNTKLSELQKDLDAAMDDNEFLMKKLKDASDELEDKSLEELEVLRQPWRDDNGRAMRKSVIRCQRLAESRSLIGYGKGSIFGKWVLSFCPLMHLILDTSDAIQNQCVEF